MGAFPDWTQRDNLAPEVVGLENLYNAFTQGFMIERELYEMSNQINKFPKARRSGKRERCYYCFNWCIYK